MLADVGPLHSYMREPSALMLHHADYLNRRDDHALCGLAFENPITQAETSGGDEICPDCAAKLPAYHVEWWRERAEAATAELELLRVKYRELQAYVDTPRPTPDSPGLGDKELQGGAPDEQGETEPTTFLDRARRELADLVGQFEDAVPYWRLKNTMQAFSDTLDTDERVLLAQEIGADGSLVRWSTRQVEAFGRCVTNSPVHEESEATWETWVQESYQEPKNSKRRFGRSRSHKSS